MTIASQLIPELIAEGQAMVKSLANRIHRNIPVPVDLDDLIAYGQVGLAEAAQDFDPEKGARFTTFAYYRIQGAIYDGVSKMCWTTRGQYHRLRYEQMSAEVLRHENESAGEPEANSPQAEASWLGRISAKLAVVFLGCESSEDDVPRHDVAEDPAPSPSTSAAIREISTKLHELIDTLPPDARQLIRTTYFEGFTLQEAAQRLGISKSWASRLHARTLEQLSKTLRRLGEE